MLGIWDHIPGRCTTAPVLNQENPSHWSSALLVGIIGAAGATRGAGEAATVWTKATAKEIPGWPEELFEELFEDQLLKEDLEEKYVHMCVYKV